MSFPPVTAQPAIYLKCIPLIMPLLPRRAPATRYLSKKNSFDDAPPAKKKLNRNLSEVHSFDDALPAKKERYYGLLLSDSFQLRRCISRQERALVVFHSKMSSQPRRNPAAVFYFGMSQLSRRNATVVFYSNIRSMTKRAQWQSSIRRGVLRQEGIQRWFCIRGGVPRLEGTQLQSFIWAGVPRQEGTQ
jgi:hypothetical protein